MKRITAILAAVLLLLVLAGCGSSAALKDGRWLCDVTLTGGTGRASVASPAEITVQDGKITATLVWSSANYDYMIVDGEEYLPETLDPGSTFTIPVSGLDEDVAVTADTTAMSTPHAIEYTLRFDSASLQPAG